MGGIYVFSEQASLISELVTLTAEMGKSCTVVAVGMDTAEKCSELGAHQVMCLHGNSDMPENYAKSIAGLLKENEAELLVVGATPSGRDLAARVAGYLDCIMVSDAFSVTSQDNRFITQRMMYGGAVTRQEAWHGLGVVTVPAGMSVPSPGGDKCEIVVIDVEADCRVTVESVAPITKEGVDLTLAEKIVCVGMGFEKKEDLKIAYDLAEALGGEVGCTRGLAEDHHWFPSYIGLSGVRVKPRLYLGLAVSGQIQHTVGIRDSHIIVAINQDSKAVIFNDCDYGMVGDMFEIVPILTAALK